MYHFCQAGKHQEYEQKLLQDLYKANPTFLQTSTCGEKSKSKPNSTQRCVVVFYFIFYFITSHTQLDNLIFQLLYFINVQCDYIFYLSNDFLSRPNSTNKEGWPSLQNYGKMVNGLTTEHRKSPPLLDCLTDSDHMTPDEPDLEQGTEQNTGLPPFPSALEPTRYSNIC